MFRDPGLLNVHMNGLDRILDCRGGIRSLDPNPLLRTMVYWYSLLALSGNYYLTLIGWM
jgi:hypothetical protein